MREIAGALENTAGRDDLIVGVSRSADIYTLYQINTIGEFYLDDLQADYYFIGIDDWRAGITLTGTHIASGETGDILPVDNLE